MARRDAKFWQRLNRLWFVPLYLLTIPFQWLMGVWDLRQHRRWARLSAG
jgi:hypothetical protein